VFCGKKESIVRESILFAANAEVFVSVVVSAQSDTSIVFFVEETTTCVRCIDNTHTHSYLFAAHNVRAVEHGRCARENIDAGDLGVRGGHPQQVALRVPRKALAETRESSDD
jgi:hypothetical protein